MTNCTFCSEIEKDGCSLVGSPGDNNLRSLVSECMLLLSDRIDEIKKRKSIICMLIEFEYNEVPMS